MPTQPDRKQQRLVLEPVADALGREAHRLLLSPELLWQQLYNRLEWDDDAGDARPLGIVLKREREARDRHGRSWLRLTTPPRESSVLRRTLSGHDMQVRSAVVSADATTVASVSFDRTLRLWDAATGRERARITTEPDLNTAILAGCASRNLLACVRADFAVCLRDAVTGEPVQTLVGHTAAVTRCAFSADGRRCASVGEDGTLRVWEVADGRPIAVLEGDAGRLRHLALSSDGRRAVSVGTGEAATLWDVDGGRPVAVLTGHADCVNWCAFSPDDRLIATASDDETLRLWDATTGGPRGVLEGHDDAVLAASFSPESDRLVSASLDDTLRLWDTASGTELGVLEGHTGAVNCCAFSPDGRFVASVSDDERLGVWDGRSGALNAMLEGHSDALNTCVFAPDGSFIVTASDDKSAKVWSVPSAGTRHGWSGHSDWVVSVAFSGDSTWAATGGRDTTIRLWDPSSGSVTAVLEGHTKTPESCDTLPNGPVLASASSDETLVWLRRPDGGADIVGRMPGSEIASFSHDARYLLLAQEHTVVLLDLHEAEEAMRYLGHTDLVTCGCFSPDDRLIVSGSRDRTLRIWDRASGEEIAVLAGHTDIIADCAFSPNGDLVASASWDHLVRVWDVPGGRERMTLTGHTLSCRACAFTADGRAVVSAGSDTTVRLWDVASGKGRVIFYALGCIECLAFSPDGRWLGVGDWGGNAYLLAVEGSQPMGLEPSAPDEESDASAIIDFYAEDLLHKFGFGDGDMLYDFVEEHGLDVDDRDLLVAVIEHLVVPRLEQAVETYTLCTLHNPIRARTIDGEEASIYSTLTPEFIEVREADIIRIAQTLPPSDDDREV
ncbi:MAG: hypothetical protein JXP72_00435 [Coriobacteriia bacterium]|nr:hypothetical protein [Coriobacteriia bacterium]